MIWRGKCAQDEGPESPRVAGASGRHRPGSTLSAAGTRPARAPRRGTVGVRRRAAGQACRNTRKIEENGAPERIRTPNPQIRSLVLYPVELRAHERRAGRSRTGEASRCARRRQDGGRQKPRKRGTCLSLEQPLRNICKGFQAGKGDDFWTQAKSPSLFRLAGQLRQR